jgi:hypothetical protein
MSYTILTRLERYNLWSTMTLQRCPSRHITLFVVPLMLSEVTVAKNATAGSQTQTGFSLTLERPTTSIILMLLELFVH